ncbi:MAG: prephenate dehydrogenase/arogenate dehydrogenase family protein [Chloroflexi bacterium]|nr:prephenate dehydrogenase/arogenate dehydrogenase family protein [Chloroflexota bacterium]
MTKLAIIGIGPIGAAIALGLKEAKVKNLEVVAAGGDKSALEQSVEIGAVDKRFDTVRDVVPDADIVLFDATHHHSRDLLEVIGPLLKPGSILTDTGSMKGRMAEWAQEFLPESAHYVGGRPVIKALPKQVKDATAQLLVGADYCIVQNAKANPQAIKVIVDIAEAVHANPFFLDVSEHDAFSAAMSHLPIVLSNAFVTTVSSSQSWKELAKLASNEFQEISSLAATDPEANHLASLSSKEALVHWIDQMIAELYTYRNEIKQDNDQLLYRFVQGWEMVARWEAGAVDDGNESNMPTASETMAASLVGDLLLKKYRDMTGKNRKSWEYFKKS